MSPSAVRKDIIAKGGSPERKNVFVTCSGYCGINVTAHEEFEKLSKRFNVILNTHFLGGDAPTAPIHPSIIDVDGNDYPFSIARVNAADVIVGYPGGFVVSSTGFLNKPLVEVAENAGGLTKESYQDVMNDPEHYKRNGQFLLNNRSAEVIFDPSVQLADAVFRAVDDSDSSEREAKEKERHKYFERKFHCIDGYEDYRIWFIVLREAQLDAAKVQKLEDLYPSLSKARCPQGKWSREN